MDFINGSPDAELEDLLTSTGEDWFRSGSSFICNPPIENTDIDFFIYTSWTVDQVADLMDNKGFTSCLEEDDTPYEGVYNFDAYRFGNINLIFMYDVRTYTRTAAATVLTKHLNVLDKEKRVAIFDNIRDNYDMEYNPNNNNNKGEKQLGPVDAPFIL